jgi:hypothetical protein
MELIKGGYAYAALANLRETELKQWAEFILS